MTIWKQLPTHHNMSSWKNPSLPITPCASPAGKLRKVMDTEASTVLSQLSSLTKLINSRSDTLEKMVSGNSIVISEMKKAVQENTKHITAVKESFDAVCAEINDMKDRVANMETQVEKCQTNAEAQERRISHLESYSRRWNLKLACGKKSSRSVSLFYRRQKINFQMLLTRYTDSAS